MHFYCSDFNAAKWLLLLLLLLQSIPSIVKSHVNVSVMKQLYLPTYAYISVRRNYNDLWFRVMMTWYILKWYKVIFETHKKRRYFEKTTNADTQTNLPHQRRIQWFLLRTETNLMYLKWRDRLDESAQCLRKWFDVMNYFKRTRRCMVRHCFWEN